MLLVAILVFQLYRQHATIRDQQNRLVDLEKLVTADSVPKATSFEYQAQCADRASKMFNDMDIKGPKYFVEDWESHYSSKLNKCLLFVNYLDHTYSPTVYAYEGLMDAYGGQIYASYIESDSYNNGSVHDSVQGCFVKLPSSGKKQICKSAEEFRTLIEVYMQE